jgi:hypothetical protein
LKGKRWGEGEKKGEGEHMHTGSALPNTDQRSRAGRAEDEWHTMILNIFPTSLLREKNSFSHMPDFLTKIRVSNVRRKKEKHIYLY